jgi:hypothetical protein
LQRAIGRFDGENEDVGANFRHQTLALASGIV